MAAPNDIPIPSPWQAGLRGARANLGPGLALQAFALALVLAYFHHTPTRVALERLVELRQTYGVSFSIATTAFCGGFLPFLYLRFGPRHPHRPTLALGVALTVFWAYKGLEIDVWYRVLAWLVGEERNVSTVAIKAALDQFVYCPIFAVPLTTLVYAWCKRDFSFRAVLADLRAPRWYQRRALPLLISNLGVWVPAVCIIYTLPTALQLPLQNVVLCFFTLLLAHLSAHDNAA